MHSFGHISRTLRPYPILEYGAPIFEFYQRGDLQSLQITLTSDTISPFITDHHGWSLLHVSLLPSQQDSNASTLIALQQAANSQ